MADKTLKVLVADDDTAVAETLRHIVVGLGHSCDLASDGRDCLKKIAQHPYDVLFLDLIMPKMDGSAVLQALNGREQQLDIVVISSEDDEAVINNVLHHGAIAYILKPVSLESVEDVLRKLAEKKNPPQRKHQ